MCCRISYFDAIHDPHKVAGFRSFQVLCDALAALMVLTVPSALPRPFRFANQVICFGEYLMNGSFLLQGTTLGQYTTPLVAEQYRGTKIVCPCDE